MSKVLVTGATGLIGGRLVADLRQEGVAVTALLRDPGRAPPALPGVDVFRWDGTSGSPPPPAAFDGVDAVVSLAGESIGAGRWTEARKRVLRASRIDGTRALVDGLRAAATKPAVLVSGSAVGVYGDRGDDLLTEAASTPPAGQGGFLAELCRDWETEARKAEDTGVRVVLIRTGVVIARKGGFLDRLLLPFRLGLGGRIGHGRQWMSWVHIDDEVGLIRHALARTEVAGPLNATAPRPATNRDFTAALAAVLHRPAVLPIPAAALRLALGDMAGELLLGGQRVEPGKALATGYSFRHADLRAALADVLGPV